MFISEPIHQPRTFELFQTLGMVDEVQKHTTPIPTMRAYKLPGGTDPVKTWDLYQKEKTYPDRPYVCSSFPYLSMAMVSKVLTQPTALGEWSVSEPGSSGRDNAHSACRVRCAR